MKLNRIATTTMIIMALMTIAVLALPNTCHATCDCWVALSNATRDGNVIMAKTPDRFLNECAGYAYYPRKTHPQGSIVKCGYIEIPQTPVTYEVIGHQPWWSWGFENGCNEYAVAIGNEGAWSKEPYLEKGLTGTDMVRLGLERAKTAYEAMHVMIDLLKKHKQGGSAACASRPAFLHHNNFLIADPNEAWVLETAGQYWVAKRITDVGAASNCYQITNDWDEADPDLISNAVAKGYCKSAEEFSFARNYAEYKKGITPEEATIRHQRKLQLLRANKGDITVQDMMAIARDHYEGTPLEAIKGLHAVETLHLSICWHITKFFPGHSPGNQICVLRKDKPAMGNVTMWAVQGNPCIGCYVPLYFGGVGVPKEMAAIGSDKYSPDVAWWVIQRLQRRVHRNYSMLAPVVKSVWRDSECRFYGESINVERTAESLINQGNEAEARDLLRRFTSKCSNEVMDNCKELDKVLDSMAKVVPTSYIFWDELQKENELAGLENLY